jgi:sugar-specific transcriptional regulator TrmB
MIIDLDTDSALEVLGLNSYETQAYRSLVVEGTSSAKELSNICGIPYGKIYEVLYTLSKKGFVEILPTQPMQYKASAPEEITRVIREKMVLDIDNAITHVVSEMSSQKNTKNKRVDSKTDYFLVNGRMAVARKIESMILSAKKNVYIITTKNGLTRLGYYSSIFKSLSKKGIDVRICTEHGFEEHCTKFPNACKIIGSTLKPHNMISVDGKSVIFFEAVPDDKDSFSGRDSGILSTNENLILFFENLFLEHHTSSGGVK